MTPQLADKLSYFFLGISFLILCVTFWVLRRARRNLVGSLNTELEQAPSTGDRPTLRLPVGYHEGS